MKRRGIPSDVTEVLDAVKGRRARIVIQHLIDHGVITTEDLRQQYGYDHPPRAIRDVLDQGIPLEKRMVKSSSGRRMAEYRLGDLSRIRQGRIGGRRQFPKSFRQMLIDRQSPRCGLCNASFDPRAMQIDHRIPYEVTGDKSAEPLEVSRFMLLCGSCNRAKSWSCEHCANWTTVKDPQICTHCYWAQPHSYAHVAMCELRRLDVVWEGGEIKDFETIRSRAIEAGEPMPDFVKAVLRHAITGNGQ